MYDGDEQAALARMLDCAIQFAWGLHYAHERGVIHQDVKPLNALLWEDGTLKVTDFGLARARQKAGIADASGAAGGEGRSLMVSMGGMTPSHCSPEQAAGRTLDRRTDVWSWAVGVLEMFQGEVTWLSGSLAAEALQAFLEHNGEQEQGIPAMPAGVADLLRRCFERDPGNRPAMMQECATALIEVYRAETGRPFPRPEPRDIGDTADTLNNRALSLIDLGKPDDAECLLDRAIELNAQHLAATYNRSLMRWRTGKQRDTEVGFELEQIRKDDPDNATAAYGLGWMRMEGGRFAEALVLFEEAVELGSDEDARRSVAQAQPLAELGAGQCLTGIKAHQGQFPGEQTLSGAAWAVAFSPDGRFALSGGIGETLCLWDLSALKNSRVLQGHTNAVFCVAFSPDTRFAASGSGDKTVRLWDVEQQQCLRVFYGHTAPVMSVGFWGSSRYVLSGSRDGTLKLWDAAEEQCVRTINGHSGGVRSVAMPSDGRFALSCGPDSEAQLRLWDVADGQCLRSLDTHADGVVSAAVSRSGRFAITGGGDGTIELWDPLSGQCLRTFQGHGNLVHSVAFGGDERFAVSGSHDRTLRLWDLASGQCLHSFAGHTGMIKGVAFSANTCIALSACMGQDQTIRFWDVGSILANRQRGPWLYSTAVAALEALERQESHAAYIENARRALETGDIAAALDSLRQARAVPGFERDKEGRQLQARVGASAAATALRGARLKYTLAEGCEDGVGQVAFSPDSRQALSAGPGEALRLWDLATGACRHTIEVSAGIIRFSADGRSVFSMGADKTLRVWDAATGENTRNLKGLTTDYASGSPLALSPDGRLACCASGPDANTARLGDTDSGKCLHILRGHTGAITAAAFSPDGHFVLTGSNDTSLQLWNTATGRRQRVFRGHEGTIRAVALSPDGRIAMSSSQDQTLRSWSTASGKCLCTCTGAKEDVYSVTFSADRRFAFAGYYSNSHKVRLWDLATGRCVRVFEGQAGRWPSSVSSVAVSPDGLFLLAGGRVQTVGPTLRLWELDWKYEYDPQRDREREDTTPGIERSRLGRIVDFLSGNAGREPHV